MFNSIIKNISVLLTTIAFLVIFSVHVTFASTILSQTVDSAYWSATGNSDAFGLVFTGVSGYFGSVTFELSSTYGQQYASAYLVRCDGDKTYCGSGTTMLIPFGGMIATGTTTGKYLLNSTKTAYKWTSTSTPYLNATSTYFIGVSKSYVQGELRGYGSASDVSSSTRCIDNYNTFCGGVNDPYVILNDQYSVSPPPPTSTSTTVISSVTPSNGSTVSTSTVFTYGFTAWVADRDIGRQFQVGMDGINGWFGTGSVLGLLGGDTSSDHNGFIVDITQGGWQTWTATTTHLLPTGSYQLDVRLWIDCMNIPFVGRTCLIPDNETNVGTTTYFSAASSTQFGQDFQTYSQGMNQFLNSPVSTTTNTYIDNCNPISLSFNMLKCMTGLFVPSSSDLSAIFNKFYNGFLSYAPWGYVSRAGGILTGYDNVATTSLSASNFTVVLPNNSIFATATSTSQLRGKTITFIDWTIIASSTKNNYWGSGFTALNSFLSYIFAGGFIFWLWNFGKRLRP